MALGRQDDLQLPYQPQPVHQQTEEAQQRLQAVLGKNKIYHMTNEHTSLFLIGFCTNFIRLAYRMMLLSVIRSKQLGYLYFGHDEGRILFINSMLDNAPETNQY